MWNVFISPSFLKDSFFRCSIIVFLNFFQPFEYMSYTLLTHYKRSLVPVMCDELSILFISISGGFHNLLFFFWEFECSLWLSCIWVFIPFFWFGNFLLSFVWRNFLAFCDFQVPQGCSFILSHILSFFYFLLCSFLSWLCIFTYAIFKLLISFFQPIKYAPDSLHCLLSSFINFSASEFPFLKIN